MKRYTYEIPVGYTRIVEVIADTQEEADEKLIHFDYRVVGKTKEESKELYSRIIKTEDADEFHTPDEEELLDIFRVEGGE